MFATTERFESALTFAYQVHKGQKRKGTGVSFIAHVLGVTAIAMEYGADEDEAIGALLHDAVEDGGGEATLAYIREQFGETVADIVLGCSDSLAADPEDKRPWLERKESYLTHLESASPSVLLVSAADKLHNVRAIIRDYDEHGEEIWARFKGRRDGTLWYYETVAHTLVRRSGTQLARDLQKAVDELLRVTAES